MRRTSRNRFPGMRLCTQDMCCCSVAVVRTLPNRWREFVQVSGTRLSGSLQHRPPAWAVSAIFSSNVTRDNREAALIGMTAQDRFTAAAQNPRGSSIQMTGLSAIVGRHSGIRNVTLARCHAGVVFGVDHPSQAIYCQAAIASGINSPTATAVANLSFCCRRVRYPSQSYVMTRLPRRQVSKARRLSQ